MVKHWASHRDCDIAERELRNLEFLRGEYVTEASGARLPAHHNDTSALRHVHSARDAFITACKIVPR